MCLQARELSTSNSTVFNKISCHSSNRMAIKKGFQWKYTKCPTLTRLFLLLPLIEMIFTCILTVFAWFKTLCFQNMPDTVKDTHSFLKLQCESFQKKKKKKRTGIHLLFSIIFILSFESVQMRIWEIFVSLS